MEDSLLHIVNTNIGEKKLETLHQLQQLFLYELKDNYYNELLLNEAINQYNIKYQSIALSNKVAYHFRFFDTDSFFHYAKIAEDFDIKYSLTKDLFHIKGFTVRRYLEQGHFGLGLKKAHTMNEEAIMLNDPDAITSSLIALATSYKVMEHPDETIHYMKEALSYLDRKEKSYKQAPYKKLECYEGIIYAYRKEKKYKEVLIYSDSLYSEIQYIKEHFPAYNSYDFEMGYLIYSSEALSYTNQLEKAYQNILSADSLLQDGGTPYFEFLLNFAKSHYFSATSMWSQAWESYQAAYQYSVENQLEKEIRDLLKLDATMLYQLGLYEKSANAYLELFHHVDSVNKERFLYEINELSIAYEIDKREDEIVQQNEKIHLRTRFNIYLTILVVLLIATSFFIWKYSREIIKKNHLLFTQIKELTEKKVELMAFKNLVKNRIETKEGNGENEYKFSDLYERTEYYMNNKKPYVNSEYGRKNLIADMNTNEVYLSKAIRNATDMTIQEYINTWRIEYAKYLLLENMNETIESIVFDSGFTSIRNFYRLFKDAYGMSPTQFRNYVKTE